MSVCVCVCVICGGSHTRDGGYDGTRAPEVEGGADGVEATRAKKGAAGSCSVGKRNVLLGV